MKINLLYLNHTYVADIVADDVIINNAEDALGLMSNCIYQGARRIIIAERNLVPAFFDLGSGIAGEVTQKFSNYNVRLAIVGDFSKYTSRSLLDYIKESNRSGLICFAKSLTEAKDMLTK